LLSAYFIRTEEAPSSEDARHILPFFPQQSPFEKDRVAGKKTLANETTSPFTSVIQFPDTPAQLL
jgi:hypothetical protein